MSNSFRPFKFFSNETMKGTILDTLEMTAITAGRSNLVTGDAAGVVRMFDRSCKSIIHEFSAYAGAVTHIRLLKGKNIIITIGDDDTNNVAIVRLWDLEKPNKLTGKPVMKEHRIFGTSKSVQPNQSEFVTMRVNYNEDVTAKLRYGGNGGKEDAAVAGGPAGISVSAQPVKEFKTCVTGFDFSEDLTLMAIGLTTGEIVFLKGDLERERSVKIVRRKGIQSQTGEMTFVGIPRTRHEKAKSVGGMFLGREDSPAASQSSSAATRAGGAKGGAGGAKGGAGAAGASGGALLPITQFVALVYVVYRDCVTVWRVTSKGDYYEDRLNTPGQTGGAKPECSCLNDNTSELVVAFDDNSTIATFDETFIQENAIDWDPQNYMPLFTTIDCGDKLRIGFFRQSYMMVLSRRNKDTNPSKFELQLYDLNIKIRALHGALQNVLINPAWIVLGNNDVMVITQDIRNMDAVQQKVVKLTEMDMQGKLDQLFSKHLYTEAQMMVKKSEKFSTQTQMDIERKYGDHLYQRGKFEDAVERYVHAIGYVEPSYVIRQFLDTQRIHNLTRYLEELHHTKHEGIANRNHTTLLLNCYTKQKDQAKLKSFIQRQDIVFDVSNAIKVCREAGYFDAATYLARAHNEPAEYVKIEMEHRHNYHEALDFVRTCTVDAAERILIDHGKELIAHEPGATTDVIIKLCTKWPGPERKMEAMVTETGRTRTTAMFNPQDLMKKHPHRATAELYIPTFVDSPLCLLHFLEAIMSSETFTGAASTDAEKLVFNTLLELYLTPELQRSIRTVKNVATSGTVTVGGGGVAVAGTTTTTGGPGMSGPFAKYLVAPSPQTRTERAMKLLIDREGRYDKYHALVLSQQHGFEAGLIFMLQSLKLHKEVFAYYERRFDTGKTLSERVDAKEKLIRSCESRRGASAEEEREMWISLLSILMKSADEVGADITRVLNRIEAHDLLPPITVIDILSSNPKLELKTVREYILKMLEKDYGEIESHQADIKVLSDKVKHHKEDILDLQTQAVVFQSNKCASCSGPLENPAYHFLCKHSFHERCLNVENQCNICGSEHSRVMEMHNDLSKSVDNHNQFFTEVKAAPDGFAVVAEYFGRSIFSNPKLRKEGEDEDSDDDGFEGFDDEENGAQAELDMW